MRRLPIPSNYCKRLAVALGALSVFACPSSVSAAVPSIPFTINLSEVVNVNTTGGTPRISVDVGGNTRYATYTSGSGTSALVFTLLPTVGDVDLDGVSMASPIDLNGGTIKDVVGNDATLTFTPSNTSGIKVNYPSLSMDFVYDSDGRYTYNGTAYDSFAPFLTATGGTFSRGSIATYFDNTGVLQTSSSGTARFDYDPITHVAKGILLEESRTNVAPYDNPIGQSASVVASNIAGPNGTVSGHLITCNGANSVHAVAPSGVQTAINGATYTDSIFVKAGTQNLVQISISANHIPSGNGYANFNLSSGAVSTGPGVIRAGANQLPNNWWRIWVTFTASGAASGNIVQVNAITSMSDVRIAGNTSAGSFYIYGPQREVGAFPTSYIPTTTAAVTRSADVLTFPTGSWHSATQGTIALQTKQPPLTTNLLRFFNLGDGTASNRMQLQKNSDTTLRYLTQVSGATVVSLVPTSSFSGNNIKIATTYKANDYAISVDGGSPVTTSSGTIPPMNLLEIGSSTVDWLNTGLVSFKYYPARLPNSVIQNLTQ